MKVAHIADVHFKNSRRPEYEAICTSLYSKLRKLKESGDLDVIVLAGDIFDDKMRASPNNLADVSAFFRELSEIAPTIAIAGNHDTNCLRPGSMDLITPIVAEHSVLKAPRFQYFRQSGVYVTENAVWSVIATDGECPSRESEDAARGENPELPLVCLFHEEVNGAVLPNGTRLTGYKINVSDLSHYDAAIGGHIHQRQMFAPNAGYSGSLVQQNMGESHNGHGFVLWDICPRTTPITVPFDVFNEWGGFMRITVDSEGVDTTATPVLPHPKYWEIVHDFDTPLESVEGLLVKYQELFGFEPRSVRSLPARSRESEDSDSKAKDSIQDAQRDALCLDAHDCFIREILSELAVPAPQDIIEEVIQMHRDRYEAGNTVALGSLGSRIRIVRLEFDNLYAFGSGNVVDFTSMEGCISGVIAPNHTGKSSLIEAVLFALYEKYPRASVKTDIVNTGASSARVQLDFEIDGKAGRFTKRFSRGKDRSSGYTLVFDGVDLTQGGTPGTLEEAKKILGSGEAALASCFQLQGAEYSGFVFATPAKRKAMLAEVLSLGSFTQLANAASREVTALKGELLGLNKSSGSAALNVESIEVLEDELSELDALLQSNELANARASYKKATEALWKAKGALDGSQSISPAARTLLEPQAAGTSAPTIHIQGIKKASCDRLLREWEICLEHAQEAPPDLVTAQLPAQIPGKHPLPAHKGCRVTPAKEALALSREQLSAARARYEVLEERMSSVNTEPTPSTPPPSPVTAFLEKGQFLEIVLTDWIAGAPGPEPPTDFPATLERISEERVLPEEGEPANIADLLTYANIAKDLPLGKHVSKSYLNSFFEKVRSLLDKQACSKKERDETRAHIMASRPELELAIEEWPEDVPRLENITETVENAHAQGSISAVENVLSEIKSLISSYTREARKGNDLLSLYDYPAGDPTAPPNKSTLSMSELPAAFRISAKEITQANTLRSVLDGWIPNTHCSECEEIESRLNPPSTSHDSENSRTALYYRTGELIEEAESRVSYFSNLAALIRDFLSLLEKASKVDDTLDAIEEKLRSNTLDLAKAIVQLYEDGWSLLRYWVDEEARRVAEWESARKALEVNASLQADLDHSREEFDRATADVKAKKDNLSAHETALSEIRDAYVFWSATSEAVANREKYRAIREAETDHDAAKQRLDLVSAEFQASEARAADLTSLIEKEKKRLELTGDVERRMQVIQAYRQILKPDKGIADRLLGRARKSVQTCINENLRDLGGRFEVQLTEKFVLLFRKCPLPGQVPDPWIKVSLSSGYEKFALGLASRLSFWQLSMSPKPDALFIDEGFGACDETYLEAIEESLETLAQTPNSPRLLFIVSHIDALKAHIQTSIGIEVNKGFSHVVSLQPPPHETNSPAHADPGDDEIVTLPTRDPTLTASGLPPDPQNPSNVYCEACKQSISVGRSARHLTSAKHTRNAARLSRLSSKK